MKIYVWIKEVGKPPRHVHISNTLENLQRIVGGYIEFVALSPKVGILVNEDGIFQNLRFNCSIDGMQLFGTIIWVGLSDEEFTDCPLTNEDMKKYYPKLFKKETKDEAI